jgi:hypothetical protein
LILGQAGDAVGSPFFERVPGSGAHGLGWDISRAYASGTRQRS